MYTNAHKRYARFFAYGDGESWRGGLEDKRRELLAEAARVESGAS